MSWKQDVSKRDWKVDLWLLDRRKILDMMNPPLLGKSGSDRDGFPTVLAVLLRCWGDRPCGGVTYPTNFHGDFS